MYTFGTRQLVFPLVLVSPFTVSLSPLLMSPSSSSGTRTFDFRGLFLVVLPFFRLSTSFRFLVLRPVLQSRFLN